MQEAIATPNKIKPAVTTIPMKPKTISNITESLFNTILPSIYITAETTNH